MSADEQHPVKEFVPKVVMDNLPVVYMPRASLPHHMSRFHLVTSS